MLSRVRWRVNVGNVWPCIRVCRDWRLHFLCVAAVGERPQFCEDPKGRILGAARYTRRVDGARRACYIGDEVPKSGRGVCRGLSPTSRRCRERGVSGGCVQRVPEVPRAGTEEMTRSTIYILDTILVASLCAASATTDAGAGSGTSSAAPCTRPGRWRTTPARRVDGRLTEEQLSELERLRSIGYLTGSVSAPATSGVTVCDATQVEPGINLYTSGHCACAILMDMSGRILHEWRRDFESVWPGQPVEDLNENTEYWRHARVFPNGDLLAIFEGWGLVKLDKDSNVLWKRLGGEHHDLDVTGDGSIYVLEREAGIARAVEPGTPILEDFLAVLNPDGSLVRKISILGALLDSPQAGRVRELTFYGDLFHTNGLALLDRALPGAPPGFVRGNVLLSMRTPGWLAVLDIRTEQISWIADGPWRAQHDPSVLGSGDILLFDNRGNDGKSRVIEVDPATGDVVWSYQAGRPDDFFSPTCGAAQRLPNGDTLVTESDRGRAFEVTRDGRIVWEYVNPARAGEHGEYIATLFEMVRLSADFPLDWLEDS